MLGTPLRIVLLLLQTINLIGLIQQKVKSNIRLLRGALIAFLDTKIVRFIFYSANGSKIENL